MRSWLKERWARFKAWIIGLLATIGIVAIPIVTTAAVSFGWTLPTQNTDGSALDLAQIVETRIYCDVDPATFTPQNQTDPASHTPDGVYPAPSMTGDLNLTFGRHDCFATVLAQYTDAFGNSGFMESDPSNIATKIVAPPKPQPPVWN